VEIAGKHGTGHTLFFLLYGPNNTALSNKFLKKPVMPWCWWLAHSCLNDPAEASGQSTLACHLQPAPQPSDQHSPLLFTSSSAAPTGLYI